MFSILIVLKQQNSVFVTAWAVPDLAVVNTNQSVMAARFVAKMILLLMECLSYSMHWVECMEKWVTTVEVLAVVVKPIESQEHWKGEFNSIKNKIICF